MFPSHTGRRQASVRGCFEQRRSLAVLLLTVKAFPGGRKQPCPVTQPDAWESNVRAVWLGQKPSGPGGHDGQRARQQSFEPSSHVGVTL